MSPSVRERRFDRSVWLAWSCAGVAIALTTSAMALSFLNRSTYTSIWLFINEQLNWLAPYLWAVVGAIIVSRHPGNTVGWLSLIIALSVSFQGFAIGVANYTLASSATPSPSTVLLGWVANWIWAPYVVSLSLFPLLFPTGKPVSPRWRWVGVGMVVLGVLFGFVGMFEETFNGSQALVGRANPVGFIPRTVYDLLTLPVALCYLGLFAAAILSLAVRYRRAGYTVRQQMKWLLVASVLTAFGIGLATMLDELVWANALSQVLIWGIPLSIGVAILRYQLFDIDVVIRKTLQYTAVTALLALIYFGSVFLLQRLFSSVTGQQSPVALVVSTLLIAALFAPLRRRIQDGIDRRFYRKKYDAQQVLAQFARTARDETDLNALVAELERVVQETLQPDGVKVWLKPMTDDRRRTS